MPPEANAQSPVTPEEFRALWEALIPTRNVLRVLSERGALPSFGSLPRHLQDDALRGMGLRRVEADGVSFGFERVMGVPRG